MPNNPYTPFRQDDPYKDYLKHKLDNRMDPLVINWKGKIGYGDFISPISYAMNMADCNGTDVILKFHWPQEGPSKFKEADPETYQDIIEQTYNILEKPTFFNVTIEHVYDSKLPYNHDNYMMGKTNSNWFHCHNLRLATTGLNDYNNVHANWKNITMVTSIKHEQPLHEYSKSKAWKDPLGRTPSGFAWPKVGALIQKRDWKLKHVHYETPMLTVIKKMQQSIGVIGYHGAHMWVARMLGLPMIIFSQKELTEHAFPWCIRFNYYSDFHPENIAEYFQQSVAKREEILNDYKYWLTSPNIYRLRRERT